jgi:phosphate transport system permease protein
MRFNPMEYLIEKGIAGTAFFSVAIMVLIFIFVFREAAPLFFGATSPAASPDSAAVVGQSESYGEEYLGAGETAAANKQSDAASATKVEASERFSLRNLFGKMWQPVSLSPAYGIWPLILGSFKVTLVAILFATPLAVLAALFTAMFAPAWIREGVKPVIEILAGFPSVVIGFFALIVLASIIQNAFGLQYRLNSFTGGLALSLAVIPIIYTIAEDALNAVPRTYMEASLALGAQRWESAIYVMLPAAIPGIFAAVLLGIGRAFGETMIVLMATGNAAILSADLLLPTRTLSATIGAEMAEVVFGDVHYRVLFFIGVILFIFSFGLNFIVEGFVRQRLQKRFSGK